MPRTEDCKRFVYGCFMLVCGAVMAQPQPAGRTVQELIQSMKTQREAQLDPATRTSIGTTSRPMTHGHPAMSPLLWSVSGLNGRYTAVMVVNRKVQVIQSQFLPVSVSGWRVGSIDEQGVGLTRGGKTLILQAPNDHSSTEAFLKALPLDDRSGGALRDFLPEALAMENSATTSPVPSSETVTQAQQLSTPLPFWGRMPAATEVLAPPVPREKQ